MKVGHGNPVGGKLSLEQSEESETTAAQLLGVPQNLQAKQPQNVCRGTSSDTHIGTVTVASVCVSLYDSG